MRAAGDRHFEGADPAEPHRAVSNSYQRQIEIETKSRYGDTYPQIRYVNQPGIYDQARQIEPRLRSYTSDHRLGRHLSEMGCDNSQKVLRRRGWTFPPLTKCRAEWEKRYPGWKWRNPEITEWQAEELGEAVELAKWRKTTWRKLATPGRNPGSEPSEQEMFRLFRFVPGRRNAKPLRRKHFFHLFRLFPLLEKSK